MPTDSGYNNVSPDTCQLFLLWQAVKKFVKLQCKCHGVSGSCSTRTCWSTLHEFRRVGSYLKKAYSQAVHVTTDQDGDGLLTTDKAARRPNRNHLVYFENSPNYCVSDPLLGSYIPLMESKYIINAFSGSSLLRYEQYLKKYVK